MQVLSNTIKQKRKEKAGKWEVPLPKVRHAAIPAWCLRPFESGIYVLIWDLLNLSTHQNFIFIIWLMQLCDMLLMRFAVLVMVSIWSLKIPLKEFCALYAFTLSALLAFHITLISLVYYFEGHHLKLASLVNFIG